MRDFWKTFEVFPYSGDLHLYKDETKQGKAIIAKLLLYISLREIGVAILIPVFK